MIEATMVTGRLSVVTRSRILRCICAIAALGAFTGSASGGADYAREERWAQEIVPAVVVGEPVYLVTPSRPRVLALYTEVANARGGVIVVHGIGVHPDWGLNGGLRTGLADARFTTLSVQMPVLAADAPRDAYAALFPEAGERLGAAIAFLHARGVDRIAIVAHSMGAVMADAYLATPATAKIDAFVPIGMQIEFTVPPREPVLDVVAENDLPQVRDSLPKRAPKLLRDSCSKQIVIAGADHYMENRQRELAAAIAPFLQRALADDC
jgi:pimeloyl-ACP methyl ester carboxylesterase